MLSTASKPLDLSKETPIHFVGIGGIGMSGLAKILLELGFQVSGSDARDCTMLNELHKLGAQTFVGHQAGNVPNASQVVLSSAISEENPEYQAAQEKAVGLFHRSDLLKTIFQGDYFTKRGLHTRSVGISGTHGKTSITGMCGVAFQGAGLNPTIVAGGLLPGLGTNAILGPESDLIVAELDESDGTIVQYTPTHSVIANLELDHADHYGDGLQEIVSTFETYLKNLSEGSTVLFNATCPVTKKLADEAPAHIKPVLIAPGDVFDAEEKRLTYWLKNVRMYHRGCYQGYVYKRNRMLGELNLTVPGRHNLFNALAAIALGDLLGADFDEMAQALRGFSGMGRRFERIGHLNGAWVIDDYAHHPTEVEATLKAARESLHGSQGRVIALFQPHRYTRLQALWTPFLNCFKEADEVWISDVYPASEKPIAGIEGDQFVEALKKAYPDQKIGYAPKADWPQLKTDLKDRAGGQDIILSMGAGDVTQLFRNWEALTPPTAI